MKRKRRPTGRKPGRPKSTKGSLREQLIAAGEEPPEHKSAEWKALIVRLEEHKGRKICGAKMRPPGWPCENPPLENGRCKFHGGMSRPPGPTHHLWQTGRYSQALRGQRIGDLYEQARKDPGLLALSEDIAVLVAKQQETLSRLPSGESQPAWEVLQDVTGQLRDALDRGADGEAASILDRMSAIVSEGLNEHYVWSEYGARSDLIRRMAETEGRNLERGHRSIAVERVNAMLVVWLDALRTAVPEEYLRDFEKELRNRRATHTLPGSRGPREVGNG